MMVNRSCSVCGTLNSNLAITCSSCGGYIQDKVASLHLFQTLWMLIESPSNAMQKIIIAQQKNYVYLLQMMIGFSYTAFICWYTNIGTIIDDLQIILLLILLIGPISGILLVNILSMSTWLIFRVRNIKVNFADVRAIISYSGFPVIITLVLIFPVEIALFGMYLFTDTVSLFDINPVTYSLILGLDLLFIVWSIGILIIGLRLVSRQSGIVILIVLIILVISMLPVAGISSIITFFGDV